MHKWGDDCSRQFTVVAFSNYDELKDTWYSVVKTCALWWYTCVYVSRVYWHGMLWEWKKLPTVFLIPNLLSLMLLEFTFVCAIYRISCQCIVSLCYSTFLRTIYRFMGTYVFVHCARAAIYQFVMVQLELWEAWSWGHAFWFQFRVSIISVFIVLLSNRVVLLWKKKYSFSHAIYWYFNRVVWKCKRQSNIAKNN